MIKILNELIEKNSWACFYTNNLETDKFIYGKILSFNDDEIAIHSVAPSGEDDGVVVMNMQNVFRIEINGQYALKMAKLINDEDIRSYSIPFQDNNLMTSVLKYSMQQKEVASIELVNSGLWNVVGIVDTIDSSICTVNQIDEYGFDDGVSVLDINSVTKLSICSQEELIVKRLIDTDK